MTFSEALVLYIDQLEIESEEFNIGHVSRADDTQGPAISIILPYLFRNLQSKALNKILDLTFKSFISCWNMQIASRFTASCL